MAGNQLQQKLLSNALRSFHRSTIFRDSKINESSTTASKTIENKENEKPASGARLGDSIIGRKMHTVSNFDKRLLVWFKHYKSLDEVPMTIGADKMDAVQSKARIQFSLVLMGFILLGCLRAVLTGKKSALDGDTVQNRVLKEHEKVKKKYQANPEKESKST